MSVIKYGQKYGRLNVLHVDKIGKNTTCVCVCKSVIAVSADDLRSGVRESCGCRSPSREQRAAWREERAQRKRQRALAWRSTQ
jgi:hypothetical protein